MIRFMIRDFRPQAEARRSQVDSHCDLPAAHGACANPSEQGVPGRDRTVFRPIH